jgi:predicted O-methyltransferase YrrM
MPLARTYDAVSKNTVTTLQDGYLDRLSRWSDIQEYLPFLYDQAKLKENTWILELGARKGNSTLAFLAGAANTGGHVWSVDVANVTENPKGMALWKRNRHWTFIHGDDMNPVVQSKLPRKVDVLFIDTSHEYEHTLNELHVYMPRVAPNGIALLHDTNLYIRGNFMTLDRGDEKEDPPVKRALDTYCKETGLSWENIPGQYGMGIIHASETTAAS